MSAERGLRNLGPTSRAWLASVGIETQADLERVGAVDAFLLVRGAGHNATRNLLWALHAAIVGIDWRLVSEVDKRRLEAAVVKAAGR